MRVLSSTRKASARSFLPGRLRVILRALPSGSEQACAVRARQLPFSFVGMGRASAAAASGMRMLKLCNASSRMAAISTIGLPSASNVSCGRSSLSALCADRFFHCSAIRRQADARPSASGRHSLTHAAGEQDVRRLQPSLHFHREILSLGSWKLFCLFFWQGKPFQARWLANVLTTIILSA